MYPEGIGYQCQIHLCAVAIAKSGVMSRHAHEVWVSRIEYDIAKALGKFIHDLLRYFRLLE